MSYNKCAKQVEDNYRGLHMSRINRRWFNKRKPVGYKILIGLLCLAALFVSVCFYIKMENEKAKPEQPVMDVKPETGEDVEEQMRVDPTKPMIAFSFDDGPSKYTERLLTVLRDNNARASFFMVGQNVGRYPDEVQMMKDLGCDIGNHTMNHRDLVKLSDEDIEVQIESTNDALRQIIGEGATMVRPPYGSKDDRVKACIDNPIVLWSIDTNDWQSDDPIILADYILYAVEDGDIVLMHDIYETSVAAAEIVIPQLIEWGYQIVSVSELAEARGYTLEIGKEYAKFYPEEKPAE